MTWGEIWRTTVALVPLITVFAPVGRQVWRKLKVKLEGPDSGGRVRRPHRHPHRYPLLQPVFGRDRERGQMLVGLVRQIGLVPLQGFPHPSRLRAAGRWLRHNLFTFDTDPKPAFDADPADFPHPPKEHRRHVDRARQRHRRWQQRLWLLAVPGFLVAVVVMGMVLGVLGVLLQWWFSLFDSPIQWPWWLTVAILRIWVYIAVGLWSVVVSLPALPWLFRSVDAWSTKRRWLKRDGREETTPWHGGTAESLLLAWLYRGGPNLDADGWQHYWHPQHPQQNPQAPTTERPPSAEPTGVAQARTVITRTW